MTQSPGTFPTRLQLWRGAMLVSIAEAILLASYPDGYRHYWKGTTYLTDDEQGTFAALAFEGESVVAAFYDHESLRNPFPKEWDEDYDWRPFFSGIPIKLWEIAERTVLPEMELEYRGANIPVVTAAMWGEGGHIWATEDWSVVLENGAFILEHEIAEPEQTIQAWLTNGDYSASQLTSLRSVFERRMATPNGPVIVEPWERAGLLEAGDVGIDRSRELLAAIGIVLP